MSSTAEVANFPTVTSERTANDQCCWDSQLQSEFSFKAKNGDNVLMMGEPEGIKQSCGLVPIMSVSKVRALFLGVSQMRQRVT